MVKWLKLVKSRFFSLPNILSSEELVPELLQEQVTGQRIMQEVSQWLDEPERRLDLKRRFEDLHRVLRKDAASSAANVVLKHIARHPRSPAP